MKVFGKISRNTKNAKRFSAVPGLLTSTFVVYIELIDCRVNCDDSNASNCRFYTDVFVNVYEIFP